MNKVYDLIYESDLNAKVFKSNEIRFIPHKRQKGKFIEDREFTQPVVPVASNCNYYVFAGGTKPLHSGHYMLMTNIINAAKTDMSQGKRKIVAFFIGMGDRGGSEDQIEIQGRNVYEVWKNVIEDKLRSQASPEIEIYVEYGGGPTQKVLEIMKSLNEGLIKNSKVIVYSDHDDVKSNYMTPSFYKTTKPGKYEMGDETPYSPTRSHANLKKAPAFDPDQKDLTDIEYGPDEIYKMPHDIIFPGSLYPQSLGQRIASGTEVRRLAKQGKVAELIELLPDFIRDDPGLLRKYLASLGLSIPEEINEAAIRRAEPGTSEYSKYLEEIMAELQHIKSGYDSRKKTGARYRKEASKIQDAYSELRRLRRKNEKILNAKMLNEFYNLKEYNVDVELDLETNFNVDDIRDFFKKLKE